MQKIWYATFYFFFFTVSFLFINFHLCCIEQFFEKGIGNSKTLKDFSHRRKGEHISSVSPKKQKNSAAKENI